MQVWVPVGSYMSVFSVFVKSNVVVSWMWLLTKKGEPMCKKRNLKVWKADHPWTACWMAGCWFGGGGGVGRGRRDLVSGLEAVASVAGGVGDEADEERGG